MNAEKIKDFEEKKKEYEQLLKTVYEDGTVTPAERTGLKELQKKLGLPDTTVRAMEGVYEVCSQKPPRSYEDLTSCHECIR